MNIIAIDPGKSSLGYCVKEGNEYISGSIVAKDKDTDNIIFARITKQLKILKDKYNIRIVFHEDYAYKKFGKSRSGTHMAEILGAIKSAFSDEYQEIIFIPVNSASWKAYFYELKLPENKTKKYKRIVEENFKREFKTCDEADAFMIMAALIYISRGMVRTDGQMKIKNAVKTAIKNIKEKDNAINN